MEGEDPARLLGAFPGRRREEGGVPLLPVGGRARIVAAELVALRRAKGEVSGILDLVAGGASPAPSGNTRRRAAGAGRGNRLPGVRPVSLLPPVDESESRSEPARNLRHGTRADLH